MAVSAQSESAPLSEKFSLESVIGGLAADLQDLRAGRISIADASARAELAKQIFNGVRLVVNTRKMLETEARKIAPVPNSVGDEP